jgi:hypothetical protein
MSYGGSGVFINCVGLTILLRIDYENRQRMRGGRSTSIAPSRWKSQKNVE